MDAVSATIVAGSFYGGIITNMGKATHPAAGGASGSTTMVMVFGR